MENNVNTTVIEIPVYQINYEPRWPKLKLPFKWYTRWAFKCVGTKLDRNGRTYGPRVIKQIQKGGKGVSQTQIGIVNNFKHETEESK